MRLSELLLLYTLVTNASRKFWVEGSAYLHGRNLYRPRDAKEILSLRRGQDRYNPDEIDCSTITQIVRDVGIHYYELLLRAWSFRSFTVSYILFISGLHCYVAFLVKDFQLYNRAS